VLLFVVDDALEDGDARLIAQIFELLRVAGDVAALVDFKAPQRHLGSAEAVGEAVGAAGGLALVDGRVAAEILNALFPQAGVDAFGLGQMLKRALAQRVLLALGQGLVGAQALNLGLPVGVQGAQ